jgi:hypothetical protein
MRVSAARVFSAICIASASVSLASRQALAIQAGTTGDTPLGITISLPVGANPPPGFYVNLHPTFSQGNSVNEDGDRTGVSSNTWGYGATWLYVPGFTVLGATYAMGLRGTTALNITVKTPKGTFNRIGIPDLDIAPLNLSWSLGHGLFFDAEFSFNTPNGTYDVSNPVNIGNNHWAITPSIALTYLQNGWNLTAHLTTETAFQNPSTHYTDGTLLYTDLTATKKFGKWTTGPVGYIYSQISPDSGPRNLNGGYPFEVAGGWDLGYDLANGVSLNGWIVTSLAARNTSRSAVRGELQLAWQLF